MVGAVPQTINERGHNLSSSGLAFNFTHFETSKFMRMDATWLVRYLFNGTKDTAYFNDSNKLAGMDMPVFTVTIGRNIIQGDKFSLGLGVNLDSRTFYSPPSQKAQKIIDAFNVGFAIGVKIKFTDWLSYHTITGYDFMFTDKTSSGSDGRQIYMQNNVCFLLGGKLGINLQPDISFKSFDSNGIHGAKIFNKNFKLGIAYAIQ